MPCMLVGGKPKGMFASEKPRGVPDGMLLLLIGKCPLDVASDLEGAM